MTVLLEVQGFAQAVADAIAAVAGVEVGMVDENLLTVVGSGKYARHIGRTLDRDSVSARALFEGRPAGCVILVACTASQKEILIGDMQRRINFLERTADLISRAFNERRQTARAEGLARQLDVVIDSVNDGILTIGGSEVILHANQSAARLLKATRDQLASCPVSSVFPQLSSDTLGEASSCEFETYSCVRGNREYWLTTARPIADDFCPHGHVITFLGIEEIPRMVANYEGSAKEVERCDYPDHSRSGDSGESGRQSLGDVRRQNHRVRTIG